jgi:S-adenosylmethionine:tRNA ribosyltransferase-isomerase
MANGMRKSFAINELDYELPDERIAQRPLPDRESSRLLVLPPDGPLKDCQVSDLPKFLHPGDLLVLNNTRVIPAKFAVRRASGGLIEGLFLHEVQAGRWIVLLNGAARLRDGETLAFEPSQSGMHLQLLERQERGKCLVRIDPASAAVDALLKVGRAPVPPYIHRGKVRSELDAADLDRYQSVFAERPGAVAAPTAGLHFSEGLLERLGAAGVELAHVTLHVGAGTFAPIEVDDLADHAMHEEWYELSEATAEAMARCRRAGGRVVAVGTTSLRVLETCAVGDGLVQAGSGWTRLFCYPPYRFRVVDGLMTNFHLPRSTLLALVMAFAGVERARAAYAHAVAADYRFFSYGDAMLVWPGVEDG